MYRFLLIVLIIAFQVKTVSAQIIVNVIDDFTLEPVKDHIAKDRKKSVEIEQLSNSVFIINKPKEGAVITVNSNGYLAGHFTLSSAKKDIINLMLQPADSLLTAYRNMYDFYGSKTVKFIDSPTNETETTASDSEETTTQNQITPQPPVQNEFIDSTETEAPRPENGIWDLPEIPAEFPGGIVELKKFLATNVKYPQRALELGIQGTVYVQFIVSKTGKVSNIRIVRGVNLPLDAESARVIEKMPDWTPAILNGKPVNTHYNLPIKFKLY